MLEKLFFPGQNPLWRRRYVVLVSILALMILAGCFDTKAGRAIIPAQAPAEQSTSSPEVSDQTDLSATAIASRAAATPPFIHEVATNAEAYPNSKIPRYEKFELTFQVETVAENLQFPYDPAPPPGVEPGIGISVDAYFSPDNWQTRYIQPAFFYQDFQDEVKDDRAWLYPTGNFSWKVRFAPDEVGDWQVKLVAQDAGGTYETEPFSFNVAASDNQGFIQVSERDPRYFEYEDGTYFPALGYNLPIAGNLDAFPIMAENGIHFIRTYLPSQYGIFGSAWSPWRAIGAAPPSQEPDARLRHDSAPPFNLSPAEDEPIARPESEVFLWLSHDETVSDNGQQWNFVPCVMIGWESPLVPLKRDTDYRLRVRYKEQDLAGPKVEGQPFGFAVKEAGWLWHNEDESQRCTHPGTGTVLAATYDGDDAWTHYPDPDNPGWQILEGRFNSGAADFLNRLHLTIENATSGNVFIDTIWVEEVLGSEQYGPNVVYKPWVAHHQYFDQRSSYDFDKALATAEQYGVYLKLVILEKSDYVLNIFEFDGRLSSYRPHENPQDLFFGNGRERDGKTKVRWLQEGWWRYLQARWGYSTHIHSWELLNEGNPDSTAHYILADELGKYFQESFIPPGQQARHPNVHLVTTSFWNRFPNQFWRSSDYPYVDYADIHYYGRETDTTPLDYIYEPADFYDMALFSQKLSLHHGARQPDGAGKPIVRGEVGFVFDDTDLFAENVADGLWLHNLIWAGVNPGGLVEMYWLGAPTQSHIYSSRSRDREAHDHRPIFRTYYNFIRDVPLNNGHYEDAAAVVAHPDLRAWGQKDLASGRVHLWIQNKNHTWKNVADDTPIPAISSTITVPGFQPGATYALEWWNPYQPEPEWQIMATENVVAGANGAIVISIDDLETDVAVKIFPVAGDE